MQKALGLCFWLLIPCSVFIPKLRSIIELIYFHGAFSEESVRACSGVLLCYSFGLLGYGMVKVLSSAYYALDKTKYAMNMSLIAILINFISNYF